MTPLITRSFSFLFIALIFTFLPSCGNDDEGDIGEMTIEPPTEYDAEKHIYGEADFFEDGVNNREEIIIDIASGVYGRIAESQGLGGSVSLPIGPMNLTDFANKRRIYEKLSENKLIVQDLSTFENREIELKESATGNNITNPNFLTFGEDQQSLFLMNSANSIYSIDLESEEITLIHENLLFFDDYILSNLFYLKEDNTLILLGHMGAINAPLTTSIIKYDLDSKAIINQSAIPESFGFVMHPDGERLFALSSFNEFIGFRLMEYKYAFGYLSTRQVSTADLDIDQLSFYLQTIHSATNTYICRGGSNSIDMPENNLYNIDLTTGELNSKVTLEGTETLLKLAGE